MEKNGVRLLVAAAVVCLCRSGWGQGPEVGSLKGEVHSDSSPIPGAEVELTDLERVFTP